MANDPDEKLPELHYPKDAYHDPNTGMFVSPDPKEPELKNEGMVQDPDTGLWVPAPPNLKPKRNVWTDTNFKYEVAETAEEVIALLDGAKDSDWLTLTDPVFGTPLRIPGWIRSHVVSISEDWADLDEAQLMIDQRTLNVKMGRNALTQQRIAMNGGKKFLRG
jgi:hypothetical protein